MRSRHRMFERVQSALDSQALGAALIGELAWALMLGGTLVFAVIMVLAICGVVIAPRSNAGRRTAFRPGIAFPLAVVTALLVYALIVSEAFSKDASRDPLRVSITTRNSWWDVRYLPEVSGRVLANELRIPVGIPVELLLTATDAPRRFHVPQLGVDRLVVPGRMARVRVTAREAAVYADAAGTFAVVAAGLTDFDEWLARQAAPGVEPTDPALVAGRHTFFSRECHACHTIRGSAARGRGGPDLTHVGSRQSLSAPALDRHLRGNNSYGKRDPELRALATYLASLK